VRRLPALLLVSAAGVLTACCVAQAMGTEKAASSVTLRSPAPSTFKGKVSSSNDSCIAGRAVKLFQPDPGGGSPNLISQGSTDNRGIWRIALEGTHTGDYFAKVKFKHSGSVVCKAAKSRTITVPG
jgi:hypothetical protein